METERPENAYASERPPAEGRAGGESDLTPDGGSDAEEPGLEARLERLEAIVSALEADDLELERALALFEEGVRHVRKAETILSETELRVEELLGDGSEARTRPFADEGE